MDANLQLMSTAYRRHTRSASEPVISMPRTVSYLACLGIWFIGLLPGIPAAAQEFFLRGRLTSGQDGGPAAIETVVIRSLSTGASASVEVAREQYTIRLSVYPFFYEPVEVQFTFQREHPLFTFDETQFHFSEDFFIFRKHQHQQRFRVSSASPVFRATHGPERCGAEFRGCSEFAALSQRYADLMTIPLDQIYGGNVQPAFVRLLRSMAIVLTKHVGHRCSPDDARGLREAMMSLFNHDLLAKLTVSERSAIGESISNATNRANYDDESINREFHLFGRDALEALLRDTTRAEMSGSLADVIYAWVALERRARSLDDAAAQIEAIFKRGLLDDLTKQKDGAAYQYFLLISGGRIVDADEQLYEYDRLLPTDEGFKTRADPAQRTRWCFLRDVVMSDSALQRRWAERPNTKVTLRKQLSALEADKVCDVSV